MFAACCLQRADKPATFAGDNGAPARFDDSFGDFQRRALSPAGRHFGDHLEYGLAAKVWQRRLCHAYRIFLSHPFWRECSNSQPL